MWGVSRSSRRGTVSERDRDSDIPSGRETYQNVGLVLLDLGLDLVDACRIVNL